MGIIAQKAKNSLFHKVRLTTTFWGLFFILSSCGPFDEISLSPSFLKKCNRLFVLPQNQLLVLYRESIIYDKHDFRHRYYLCLFNKNGELIDQIPFRGKIIKIANNTIYVDLHKKHFQFKDLKTMFSTHIGSYQIKYKEVSGIRIVAENPLHLLDSLQYNPGSKKVTLFYRNKYEPTQNKYIILPVSELYWEPEPSYRNESNVFYTYYDSHQTNGSSYIYYTPVDSAMVNHYFDSIIQGLKSEKNSALPITIPN